MFKKITHAASPTMLMKWLPIFLAVILVAVIIVFQYKQQNNDQSQSQETAQATKQTEPVSEPRKTDFGANMPTDFPTDIPVENGVKVEQSYRLDYAGQKQLTIVFLSDKTVEENYSLYADFLKKQGWTVSNKYESPALSSLYGTKESNDINVTISEGATIPEVKSQVSISVLKK